MTMNLPDVPDAWKSNAMSWLHGYRSFCLGSSAPTAVLGRQQTDAWRAGFMDVYRDTWKAADRAKDIRARTKLAEFASRVYSL